MCRAGRSLTFFLHLTLSWSQKHPLEAKQGLHRKANFNHRHQKQPHVVILLADDLGNLRAIFLDSD